MDVGFIGLGIMGAPMAGHLIAGGHRLHPKTRRSVPERLLQAGGIACASAAHGQPPGRRLPVRARRAREHAMPRGRPDFDTVAAA